MKNENKEKQMVEKKEELKPEENLESNEEVNIDPEILEKIVSELEEKYDLKKENIKIVKMKKIPTKKMIYKYLLRELFFWFVDFLLIIALNGYLEFSEPNILNLFLFSIVFYIIEFVSKIVIQKYYQKLVIYSFGSIMIPMTILSLILSDLVVNLESDNTDNLIAFYILFIIIRLIIRFVLMRKEIQSMMKGRRK